MININKYKKTFDMNIMINMNIYCNIQIKSFFN